MDDIARPPVRLQANSSTSLSLKATQAHIDAFLNDFQSRSSPSKGGDATMTAQLDKLSKALKEQRARDRNRVPVGLTGECFLTYFLQ
ncbi:hypothetical protein BDN67DRAFT_953611 [Paxillus ammoniavirescens]|nr:hypothetical protein BDN67DRAFT_953611 [Paxillus ammoniavirescens]